MLALLYAVPQSPNKPHLSTASVHTWDRSSLFPWLPYHPHCSSWPCQLTKWSHTVQIWSISSWKCLPSITYRYNTPWPRVRHIHSKSIMKQGWGRRKHKKRKRKRRDKLLEERQEEKCAHFLQYFTKTKKEKGWQVTECLRAGSHVWEYVRVCSYRSRNEQCRERNTETETER